MIDLPEVRQILRDSGLFSMRAQRMNRRGQLPSNLRHYTKAEDSEKDTDDEDQYDKQMAELNQDDGEGFSLGIVGTSMKINKTDQ